MEKDHDMQRSHRYKRENVSNKNTLPSGPGLPGGPLIPGIPKQPISPFGARTLGGALPFRPGKQSHHGWFKMTRNETDQHMTTNK